MLQCTGLYCNRVAVRLGIVLQEGQVYCNRGSLAAEETVLQYSLVGCRFVFQYKLYCELGRGLCRDTARAGAGPAQLGAATRPGASAAGRCDTARGARQGRSRRTGAAGARQGRAAGARQGRAAGARQGRAARKRGARGRECCWPTGCALGALSLFLARFDSVLFLSQFLDMVREPGS